MRNDDFIFISSAVGSLVLLFSSTAAFYIFGPEPLWLPMKGGGEYFNPQCLTLLLVLIPVGSLLGFLASVKKQSQCVRWLSCGIGWFVGCIIGGIVLFPTVTLLGILHPLLVCGLGLVFTLFMFWATLRKAREKPSYIKLPM